MLRRGEALLEIGDVSGARRFFERAAQSGSAAAALAMGATFDPLHLAAIGARGIPPERATALRWYRRALALGAPEAQRHIEALEATP
jgi:TPR repeat protein